MVRGVLGKVSQRATFAAFDLRGHGETESALESAEGVFTAAGLAADVEAVARALLDELGADARCVLVGHSMGGAAVVRAAPNLRDVLGGLVVIDVVEGTALASLRHMRSVLTATPARFESAEHAIAWALRAGVCGDPEAARVSVPPRLRPAADGQGLEWRTDLSKSEPHWEEWYRGLSDAFLKVPAPKVLVLAGTDRLDRALTVASMQGKYQSVILPQAGHAVQEDAAEAVASALAAFLRRQRLA